jgi:hypothetical protein
MLEVDMKLDHYRLDMRDRGQLLLTAAAATFAGLFLLGLIGFVLADLAAYPAPFSTTTSEVEDYFRESRDPTRFNAFVQLAAALPLLVYSAVAATRLRALGDRSAAPAIAVAAGTASAACLALSAMTQWALSRPHTVDEGGALVRSLQDLAFAAGGPGHVGFLGLLVASVSLAAWSGRHLPGWIAALGGLVAALSMLSILTLIFDDASSLLPVARFPTFIWLLVTALALPGGTVADQLARDLREPRADTTPVRPDVARSLKPQ